VKRIDRFFTDYMGAPDTDLTHGISRIVLLASIRRVYEPGCKFDYMTVLEGPEGRNKSSAIAALYGKEFVSDQSILGVDDKQLQEAVRGRWAIEAADLSGMRKADVDRVKAQLSRLEDRSRPAYGRAVVDAPRSCIFFGTTNETEYLRSQTGNRRFFPLPVEHIKVADISRDRDQIWAEAMLEEQFAESIMLPEPLWKLAAIEQDKRTIRRVRATETTPQGEERISSHDLLHVVLGLSTMQSTPDAAKRLGTAMRKLGWNGPDTLTIKGKLVKGYARIGGVTDEEVS
jgi:predicted P-loop ATPase